MSVPLLAGKTVLVTGAAQRIGRALALACARSGADILIHYRSSEIPARHLQDEIIRNGNQAWLLKADLQVPGEVIGLIEQAVSIQPFNVLINNAAIFEPLSLEQTKLTDWERHFNVNLTAPFLLSQAFAQHIHPRGNGHIVNLLDWRALRPIADHLPYTVSKAALADLTRSLAVALAPRINVNGLALGAIIPPSGSGLDPHILRNVPAGKWGTLQDVENALLFLLSGASYITGEIIHVDGGRHLR
jgi:pteridine reductase